MQRIHGLTRLYFRMTASRTVRTRPSSYSFKTTDALSGQRQRYHIDQVAEQLKDAQGRSHSLIELGCARGSEQYTSSLGTRLVKRCSEEDGEGCVTCTRFSLLCEPQFRNLAEFEPGRLR